VLTSTGRHGFCCNLTKILTEYQRKDYASMAT